MASKSPGRTHPPRAAAHEVARRLAPLIKAQRQSGFRLTMNSAKLSTISHEAG